MAVNTQYIGLLRQARARRAAKLSRYLSFDSSRYLLSAIVLLCLMSLITLAQTGVVATRGYAVTGLEAQRTSLLRQIDQLEVRYAEAQSLEYIRARAEHIGMRPIEHAQVRYITIQGDEKTLAEQCDPALASTTTGGVREPVGCLPAQPAQQHMESENSR